MSRQNRNTGRDRKSEETKRDVSTTNERYPRTGREEPRANQGRNQADNINGLDKYRLNDLYERSSI
jgi:hypothetical protein